MSISHDFFTFSCGRNARVTFEENIPIENYNFSKLQTLLSHSYFGTVVNRALPSEIGGSLEFTLTIPLRF